MTSPSDRYDLVIFGATGFTGQYAVEEVARAACREPGLTWAVSGRSAVKLNAVLSQASKYLEKDLNDIPKIIADVDDKDSLNNMAQKAHIVLDCVGPYRFYGRQVVKACVDNGAHFVDISGEPFFLESMVLDFHEAAKEKGVYVVGACGFDCVPNEMATKFLQDNFTGDLNSVESYLKIWGSEDKSRPPIHYGTYQSLIHGIGNASALPPLRKRLFTQKLPTPSHKIQSRGWVHYNPAVDMWSIPFLGTDRSVLKRTQYYNHTELGQRPVQVQTYVEAKSRFGAWMTMFGLFMFGVMASFKCGRYLLEKYPKFFTGGLVGHEGPSRQQMADAGFSWSLVGQGWEEKLMEPSDKHSQPPNKQMIVKVEGPEPGYVATPIFMVESALVILRENDKMPGKGGVLTPGAAFANTSLIERLKNNRINFSIVDIN